MGGEIWVIVFKRKHSNVWETEIVHYRKIPMRVMAEDHIYFGPTGLVMGRNSPYASDVDWVLGHLVQGGIVNKLFRNGQSSR